MEALANLGINGKLFLAQAVNFLILLFILHRYAYRPMLAFLEKRTERIEQGLEDAETAQKKLSETEAREKEILAAARTEAKGVIAAAEEMAKKRGTEYLADAERQATRFLEDARRKIEEEKTKMLQEAKTEIFETIVLAVEKIVKEKIDSEKDRELIERVIHR